MKRERTYRDNAKAALKRVTYITNQEHDQGLLVCGTYRDMISEEEFSAINYMCMAYANDEGCDRDFYLTAMCAIRRVRGAVQ